MTWGRNDLRRIDLGAKRLGANRLGGETTGYHINYFCCYFVLNIYSCYVEVCVTVSNENFICKYSVVILT